MRSLLSIDLDAARWLAVLRVRGLLLGDPGYLAHMWLSAVFGPRTVQPFHFEEHPGCVRILGYVDADEAALRESARAFATPEAYAAARWDSLHVKALPVTWPVGLRVGFHLRVCPTVRRTRGGGEVDAWSHAGRPEGGQDATYAEWVRSAMARHGVAPDHVRVVGRRTVQLVRREQGESNRRARALPLPDVAVEGVLSVSDSAAFDALLARGVGRHRAFGFGMLRLVRPPC